MPPTMKPMTSKAEAATVALEEVLAETIKQGYDAGLFAPRNRKTLFETAEDYYRAGLLKKYLPRNADGWTAEQRRSFCLARAVVVFTAGAELGLLPLAAVRNIYFVEDQPCPSAKSLTAACLMRTDVCEIFHTIVSNDKECVVEVKRRGWKESKRLRVTIEQFASLVNAKNDRGQSKRPTWTLYPSRMLVARATSWAANEWFPDITCGMHAAEEMVAAHQERGIAGTMPVDPAVERIMEAIETEPAGPPETNASDSDPVPEPPKAVTFDLDAWHKTLDAADGALLAELRKAILDAPEENRAAMLAAANKRGEALRGAK